MRRLVCLITTLILLLSFCVNLVACNEEDEEISSEKKITVFSWEDYIDLGDEEVPGRENSILDDFEAETGIQVNYVTFANSEEMYNELHNNPNACDLLCPSEYMIMKMMSEGLLRKFPVPKTYSEKCSPFIIDKFSNLKIKNNKTGIEEPIMGEDETYACGYMWGTMGYVFDAERFSEEELDFWNVALDSQFYDKVTVKDSVRDTYIMAIGAVFEDELLGYKSQLEDGAITDEEYNLLLTDVFNRCDQETIDKVEDFLIDLRENLYYFEVDNAKADIIKGRIDLYLAWSGDAVYAMDTGEEVGINLAYVVPKSGSNIWFDGFVMPKDVSDSQATLAVEFLDYLSRPESAVRNMEYIGYSSVISGDAEEPFTLTYLDENDEVYSCEYTGVLDWVIQNYGLDSEEDPDYVETVDLSYFFGEEGKDVYSYDHGRQLYGLYSDTETIKRCVIMKTFNEEASNAVDKMWKNVKFIQLPLIAIIIITVLIVLFVALFIVFKKHGGDIIYWINDKIIYRKRNKDLVVKVDKSEKI